MNQIEKTKLHQLMTLSPKDMFLVEECEFPSVVHIPRKAYEHKEDIASKCPEIQAYKVMTQEELNTLPDITYCPLCFPLLEEG